jgi:coenzyme F420 hydrogenase subunit beta
MAVCPKHAIFFVETVGGYYFPRINVDICTQCGLCLSICPGIRFCEKLMEKLPADPFIGVCLASFIGRAVDAEIFKNSQSGGVVSAILLNLLQKQEISGAIVVVMQSGNPPRPKVQLATTIEQIIAAQKSKYCPVPLLSIIDQIKDSSNSVALVGLPCHMHGLYNLIDKIPGLKEKIAYKIGLICDRLMTYAAIDYLIYKTGINSEGEILLNFRDKSISNFPGDVHVFFDKQRSVIMKATTRLHIKDYFTPTRCRLCFDKMNIFADLTVGDPWGIEDADHRFGESVVIGRSEKGMELINKSLQDRVIDFRRVPFHKIVQGQSINNKITEWTGYIEAWKDIGLELPNYYHLTYKNTGIRKYNKIYLNNLKLSFNIDKFSYRIDLFKFVDKIIARKYIIRKILSPLKYIYNFYGKLRNGKNIKNT